MIEERYVSWITANKVVVATDLMEDVLSIGQENTNKAHQKKNTIGDNLRLSCML